MDHGLESPRRDFSTQFLLDQLTQVEHNSPPTPIPSPYQLEVWWFENYWVGLSTRFGGFGQYGVILDPRIRTNVPLIEISQV